ncbi:DNA polymerase/3'-5' exonuclease PolX [Bacillota bacterium LX-D]|nr:DNA polymerase/3'-5' exonuclease PolX [Bacillota bacterium LX-D]
MTNLEIAWILQEIADLLELQGEDPFKVMAYRQGARTVRNLGKELTNIKSRQELEHLPGIGKKLSLQITELLATGKCALYQRLKKEIPMTLKELLKIPGLGPKSIKLIHERLGVNDLADLEKATLEKKIRTLPGMGSKTELNILRSIEMLKQNTYSNIPIGIAMPLAVQFIEDLKQLPEVHRGVVCGSLRRGKDQVEAIDLLVSTTNSEIIKQTLRKHPQVKKLLDSDLKKCVVLTWLGIKVIIEMVEEKQFWIALYNLTGSKKHKLKMKERAEKLNLRLTEQGIYPDDSEDSINVNSEADIYKCLGMLYIPPELREGEKELQAALKGKIPQLLEIEDLKGDLHLHTSWSDGVKSIENMVEKAKEKKYEYIAITDHSKSLKIAGGLSEERLKEQHKLIRELNNKSDNLQILTGVETDILDTGQLDYDNDILDSCDLVIASIHSGFRQDREKITGRIEAALKNPYVHILAHPTGRIIGRRNPYKVDLERIFALAHSENKILEINSSVDRLDLSSELAYKAAYDYKIPISIDTDAHDTAKMDEIAYGVLTARRGWLTKEHVINTKSLIELKKCLSRKS